MAKKAFIFDGTNWIDIAQSTADLTNYPTLSGFNYGFRNAIINGGFDIWQRGTTFTANNVYTADRWWFVNDGVGATSVDRVAADSALIPGCEYFLRMTRTSGTNRWTVGTNLETSVVKKFKGKTVTLSYWLRKGSSLTADTGVVLKTASAEAKYNSTVDSSSLTITAAQLSTSTFTKFTQTLTIPAGSTALGLAVEIEVKSQAGAANAFLDIAMVQLEEGAVATPFEQRPIGIELALCQRYYQIIPFFGVAVNGGEMGASGIFKVTMRTTPSMGTALGNGLTGNANNALTRIGVGSTGVGSATAGQISNNAITAIYCSGLTSGAVYSGSIDVSAEL